MPKRLQDKLQPFFAFFWNVIIESIDSQWFEV